MVAAFDSAFVVFGFVLTSLCRLCSGMPELKLGLNDKVMFEATGRKFHKLCVP